MGCTASRKVSEGSNLSVQDEARSFRSKVDAIKFMCRNIDSRHAFQEYLENKGGVEYLICFGDLEEIKMQRDENMIAFAQSTIAKYDVDNDCASLNFDIKGDIPLVIWEKLRRLRILDFKKVTRSQVVATVSSVQNQLLAELANPFEGFLESAIYQRWKENQVKAEKKNGNKNMTQVATNTGQPIMKIKSTSAREIGATLNAEVGQNTVETVHSTPMSPLLSQVKNNSRSKKSPVTGIQPQPMEHKLEEKLESVVTPD